MEEEELRLRKIREKFEQSTEFEEIKTTIAGLLIEVSKILNKEK